MLKKLFVVFCVIALALSVFSMTAAAQNSEPAFEAGYALVDINPYWSVWTATGGAIPHAKYTGSNIMPLPMDGYGGSMSRLAEPTLTDDNGDGIVGAGDGLQATCIALHDGNQYLLLIAVDMLRIDDIWGMAAREMISAATGIPVSNIMLSASHTHGGVDMDCDITANNTEYIVKTSKDTYTGTQISQYRNRYVEYVKEQMVALAQNAIDNATAVTARRGTIKANAQSGVEMNAVRHFVQDKSGTEYVCGPNFNGNPTVGSSRTVSDADDRLHVLEFIPQNGEDSILLVNWRAHTNVGAKQDNHYLSGDYVGSMRKTLSDASYRASFYLGAAGNLGSYNQTKESKAWYTENGAATYAQRSSNYGTTLARVVLALMNHDGEANDVVIAPMDSVATGEIRTESFIHKVNGNVPSDVEKKAAAEHNAVCAKKTTTYPCVHTVSSGEQFVIASSYHADSAAKRGGYGSRWIINSKNSGVDVNVLTIGSELAFVTAPFELFDRYSNVATLETVNVYNDWDNLAKLGFGTPFVLTCTNEYWGYVSNQLGFTYNTAEEHYGVYAVGCYEAQSGYAAAGSGEALIEVYAQTLMQLSSVTKGCAACGEENVQWTALTEGLLESKDNALSAGHYYLQSDLEIDTAITSGGTKVCLDLNGCTLTATGTDRTLVVSGSKTLNILDTSENQTGAIVGSKNCTASTGGNLYVDTATVNLYSGTIIGGHATQYGGNIFLLDGGTINLYGGLVENGTVDAGDADSAGGNICGASETSSRKASNICLAGGMVRGGAIGQNSSDATTNIYAQGDLTLTGTTAWDEPVHAGIRSGTNVIVDGVYTGKLHIWDNGKVAKAGTVIGSGKNGADISGAQITVEGVDDLILVLDGDVLKFVQYKLVAKIGDTEYATLAAALAVGGTENQPIVLVKNVEENAALTKTAYLDLNGHNVASVTTGSYKLYVMDSATADFDVSDGNYGKILVADKATNVKAMTGYLKAADELSFHKYEMMMDKLVVNTLERGITYMSSFKGDRFVQEQIKEFGIAMRAYNAPNETSIWADTDCKTHVALTKEQWTNNAIKSVYVTNIIDPTLDAATNQARAQVGIFGRAYILLEDGTMLFGKATDFSMQSAMEHVDYYFDSEYLDAADRQNLVNFYKDPAYMSFMETWDIPHIKADAAKAN